MKFTGSTKSIALVFFIALAILVFLYLFVFTGQIVLPQFFNIFGYKIYYYGLILALAVGLAYFYARRRLSTINLSTDNFDNIVVLLIVTGFIGARVYHVFSSFSYYQTHWIEIFYVWNGGLSIFGAVIASVLALFIYQRFYLKSQAVSFMQLLDFLAPSVIVGQVIGRFGNLFNYEIYGTPTNMLWKMFVPIQFRIPPFETFQFFHPLFLYEAIAGLLILLILVKWLDIVKYLGLSSRVGQIFFVWLGLYNLVRFLTEFLRIDSPYFFGVRQNLLTAGLLVIISIVMFIKITFYSSDESKST